MGSRSEGFRPVTVKFGENDTVAAVRKHFTEYLQKNLQTKPIEVIILYKGKKLDDTTALKTLDPSDFLDNGFLIFYKL